MEFDDDFFFEEDKILIEQNSSSSTDNNDSSTINKNNICNNSLNDSEADQEISLMNNHLQSSLQSSSIESCDSTQMTMMENRIPDVLLTGSPEHSAANIHLRNQQMGMTITSGSVIIQKDSSNLIGISIGGGAPYCPCLYIVQVFDNTPAASEGTLQSGDELCAINSASVKGKTKVEVAKMIQACENQVSINYNKLHADPRQGRSLDIALKKVKHRLVESIGSATADALGLSRAILCNDALVQRLMALQYTENLYRGLVAHAKSMLYAFFDLTQIYKVFGDAFAAIGVREPQPRASEAFRQFGEQHRQTEKFGVAMLKTLKPILTDLGTYLHKAIPDTRLTISKYADAKFEYLSYCLKVKELDDEEQSYVALQEPLYRVETGNYEYRLILRCRQQARLKFAKLRSDVLVKLELLDNKHVQDIVWQFQKFASGLAIYYANTRDMLAAVTLFPVEVDLTQSAFQYKSTGPQIADDNEDEDDNDFTVKKNDDKSDDDMLILDTNDTNLITP